MSDYVNLDHVYERPAQEPEEDLTLTGDIFDKAVSSFTLARADEAIAAGVYPYFKPIAEQKGGTVKVNGREMIITGQTTTWGLPRTPASRRRLARL